MTAPDATGSLPPVAQNNGRHNAGRRREWLRLPVPDVDYRVLASTAGLVAGETVDSGWLAAVLVEETRPVKRAIILSCFSLCIRR